MKKATVLALSLTLAGLLASCSNDSGGGEGVLPGVQSLLFAQRAYIGPDGSHQFDGMGNIFDYQRYVPGGGLFTLTPPTPDGELFELTGDFEGVDISGVDLSYDAKEVVFSMRHSGDDHYHVWARTSTAPAMSGSSPSVTTTTSRRSTRPRTASPSSPTSRTPRWALAPTSTTTRASSPSSRPSALSGGDADRMVCSQNLSHTLGRHSLLSDGRVLYSRWEHLGPVNDVKLFAMNPDCSNMMAVAGQFGKGFNSLVQARELPGRPGEFVGIGTSP